MLNLVDDAIAALYGIRTVGRIAQGEGEERELVEELLHVGIVAFRLVEYEIAGTVHRFEVSFDTCCLVGFLLLVSSYVELYALLASHLGDERLKYLLKERVLKFVVLHVAIDWSTTSDKCEQLHIPVDELGIERLSQKRLYDVQLAGELAEE